MIPGTPTGRNEQQAGNQKGKNKAKRRQRELEMTDFAENGVVSLHWVGADGRIIWANQAELDFLGYTSDEYIGHPIAEFHADQAVIEDILKRLTAGEKLSNYEARLRCKDGSIKQVLISSSGLFENGELVHTRCFTVDITQRKQAEEHIRLLYQLTAALSEALTLDQVAQVIVERGIVMSGASAGSIFLLTPDQIQLEVLVSVNYSQPLIAAWQQFSANAPVPLAESVQTRQPLWLSSREAFQTRFPTVGELTVKEYQSWAALPLMAANRCIGALGLSFSTPQTFDDDERAFMVALGQQCALALDRAQLAQEARDQAVAEERQQIGRDLHDSVSQSLFSINMLVQTLPYLLEKDPERAQTQLQQLMRLSQGANAEMRTLLLDLRPHSLVKIPLPNLVTQLVSAVQASKTVAITAQVELDRPLPDEVHVTLYRIIQESLNNLVKHSRATEGDISITIEDGYLILRIWDNGQGFDTHEAANGLGLGIMRERAGSIGATFEVVSQIGLGTEIIVKRAL